MSAGAGAGAAWRGWRFRGAPGWWVIAAMVCGSVEGAEPRAIALPPFLVEEAAKGPPWRYTQAMGYEILSRCNDATTRRVVETHHRLHQMLEEIFPASLQLTWWVPKILVLYDDALQPAASQEVIARLLRGKAELPPIEVDLPGGRGLRMVLPARRVSFLPNLRLWDRDGMAVFMIVRKEDFDPQRLGLTYDYIAFLVRHRVPTLPAWFIAGFLELYRDIQYEGRELQGAPLTWITAEHTEAVTKDPKTAPPVLPLAEFFAGAVAPAGAENAVANRRWQAQAGLFVRWGLEPGARARREGFFKFTERAAAEGVTEALFRECFGIDYTTAHAELTAYLPNAVRREPVYKLRRPAALPAYTLTNATDAQVARIKGDWERMEVPYVREISPELTEKYLEQARRTLRRGQERSPGDGALRAVLGLCEADAGNDAGAREHLEAAARLGALRPRANYELARLRLAERRAAAGAGGLLSTGQLAEVLQPLFAAREQRPPLAEVYELIAEAWRASGATPTRRHLAVLDEGVRLFPRRLGLVLDTSELYLRHGYRVEAAALARLAGRVASDEATKARAAEVERRATVE